MITTIAICTRNRADSLRATLASLTALRAEPRTRLEILVINNNCTDHTPSIVAGMKHRLPLREVRESGRGLSAARNRACSEAAGQLVIFTDDDVRVDPGFVTAYVDAYERFPDAAFFGGSIEPRYVGRIDPRLLVRAPFSIRGFCPSDRPQYRDDGLPYFIGANTAYRCAVLRRGFAFHEGLGAGSATGLIGGEETRMQVELEAAGHRGVFVPNARVEHIIPAHRVTWPYLTKWHWRACAVAEMLGDAPQGRFAFGLPRWYYRLLLARLAALPASLACGDRSRLFDNWVDIARAIGTIVYRRRGASLASATTPAEPSGRSASD